MTASSLPRRGRSPRTSRRSPGPECLGHQQVSRELLELFDQVSGWEYRKGRGGLPEVGGDLPGRGERPDAGLAVPPGGRLVVDPLAGHDILNEEPNRSGRHQQHGLDGRSDRRGQVDGCGLPDNVEQRASIQKEERPGGRCQVCHSLGERNHVAMTASRFASHWESAKNRSSECRGGLRLHSRCPRAASAASSRSMPTCSTRAAGDELIPQLLGPVREWPLPVGQFRESVEQHFCREGDDAPRAERWMRAAGARPPLAAGSTQPSNELGDDPPDPLRLARGRVTGTWIRSAAQRVRGHPLEPCGPAASPAWSNR